MLYFDTGPKEFTLFDHKPPAVKSSFDIFGTQQPLGQELREQLTFRIDPETGRVYGLVPKFPLTSNPWFWGAIAAAGLVGIMGLQHVK